MTILMGLLRVVLVLVLVRFLARGAAALFRATQPKPRPEAPPGGAEMVRDRVCNTFLPRSRALHEMIGGEEHFFCSEDCRQRALARVPRAS